MGEEEQAPSPMAFGPSTADQAQQATGTDTTRRMDDAVQQTVTQMAQKCQEANPNAEQPSPQQLREIAEAARAGDRELFDQRVQQHAPNFAEQLTFDAVSHMIAKNMESIHIERSREKWKAGDKEGAGEEMEQVLKWQDDMKEHGDERSANQMQQESLMRIGDGLNDTQKADMLNAALAVGFSAAAVYAAGALLMGLSEGDMDSMEEGMDSSDSQIDRQVKETMEERVQELRNMTEKMQKEQATKREVDEAERRLAQLVGTAHAKEARITFERQGGEMEQIIERALAEQLELAKQLHTGHLEAVSPKKQAMA